MTRVLEQAIKAMVLDYLKRRVNNHVYNRWDKGYYGEVPLPKLPYEIDIEPLKVLIAELEADGL